jgi:uncharacterized repeat protein (TIGR03803 family)
MSNLHSALNRITPKLLLLAAIVVLLAATTQRAPAQTLTTLHTFTGAPYDGANSYAGLVMDAQGNLYGTADQGGDGSCSSGCGIVFEVTASGTEEVLYNFTQSSFDYFPYGAYPWGTLVSDALGNLYGTTVVGGVNSMGTVFELTPSESGWTETVLYSFCSAQNCADGSVLYTGVVRDQQGNLYGATTYGGARDTGTVFEVTPTGTETVLHSFRSLLRPSAPSLPAWLKDGAYPSGLILDSQGNLYGTTSAGGASSSGVAFKLDPSGTETLLHTFTGPPNDGSSPGSSLIMDAQGNLYGTTESGGAYNNGTVFKLTPSGTETVLHSFAGSPNDGFFPEAPLIMDAQGNLYGTTFAGGNPNCVDGCGTIFEITSSGTEKVLYSFTGGADGAYSHSSLIFDAQGNLYGTTYAGGADNDGTVFKLTP